jgi:hypothetical protein
LRQLNLDPILPASLRRTSLRRRRARRRLRLPSTGRIFGIGLTRTATSSLTEALNVLGFWSLHYPEDEVTRAEITSFLAAGGDRLRLSILDTVDALTDTPICATFEALDAAYPGSKFILSTRDKPSWLDSCERFWRTWMGPALLDDQNPNAPYVKAIHERVYGGADFDRARLSHAYDEHDARVRRHFRDRPGDLLVIDICGGESWQPLCEFLAAPLPDSAFPWSNSLPAR